MELKVGMYVRNNHFGIGKINKEYFDSNNKHWFNVHFNCYEDEDCHCGICEETIGFKARNNIIDLIEVGDYVNGNKIVHIQEEEFPYYPKRLLFAGVDKDNIDDVWVVYNNEQIKSIVTKEQFESMSYKVGE